MSGVRLFIVRIQTAEAGFHASARRVDEEVARQFDQPLQLLEFLIGSLPPARPVPPQGEADEPDATP